MAISSAPLNGSGLGEAFRHNAAATSTAFTLAAAPTSGDTLLICAANGDSSNHITSIVQTGVTWTLVSRANALKNVEVWKGVVGSSPAAGFTVNSVLNGSADNIRLNVSRWQGQPEVLDISASSSSATDTATINSGNITPTAGKEMVLLAVARSHLGGISAPSNSFTALTSGSTGFGFAYRKIASTSGSYSTSWTQTSGIYEACIVAIKAPVAGNALPVATITTPADNSTNVPTGTSVSFAGTGSDTEDGALTGASLVWTSNLDGQIGVGTGFSKSNLSVGTHTITLTATDSAGQTGTDTVQVTISSPTGTIYSRTVSYTTTTGTPVNNAGYKIFIPANYDSSVKHPTILVLGGSGQRGTDNTSQMTDGLATRVQAELATWPTITIFPQWPASGTNGGREWAYPLIAAVQAAVEAEWNIDTGRRYLTGFSLGAFVGFEYLFQQPSMFAACLFGEGYINQASLALTTTVSPATNRHAADLVAGACTPLPVHHYLSDGDTTTGMQSGSLDTKAAFEAVDPNYLFVQLNGLSHTAAYAAMYADDAAFTWLLSQGTKVTPPLEFDTTRRDSDFSGAVWNVSTGTQFNTALAGAVDGDRIEIALGAVIDGQWTLRNRGTSGWVEIRSALSTAALDAACPQNTRMTPTIAASLNLATLRGNQTNGGIISAFGAAGYRITALNVTHANVNCNGLIRLGNTALTQDSQICSRMGVDRCVLTGSINFSIVRGVQMGCSYSFVKDSWITDMYNSNSDSQAIGIFGVVGPYLIQNNYMEGWSEGFIVGGSESGLAGTNLNSVPSDVVVRGNYITRNPTYKGTGGLAWNHKNGGEFKSCRRGLQENNIIQYTWKEGQTGMACSIKSDNTQQQTSRPLAGSQDIEVRNNWFKNVGCALSIAANPDNMANINKVHRVYVHDNLFEHVNESPYTSDGKQILLSGALAEIYIEHNTIVNSGASGITVYVPSSKQSIGTVQMRSNLFQHGTLGAKADGVSEGTASLDGAYGDDLVWDKMVLVGLSNVSSYPAGTLACANEAAVGYADLAGGDYSLASGSPFKGGAHDGGDIGISNWSVFQANIAGASSGVISDPVTPIATSISFTTQPSDGLNGAVLATQPAGKVLDQFGVLMSSYNGTITLTGTGAAVAAGGTVTVSNGLWQATGVTMDAQATTAFTITASAPGLLSATSISKTLTVVTSVPTNTIPKFLPSDTIAKVGKTLIQLWLLS